MIVNILFTCVMQVVTFYKESLGYRQLYLNMEFIFASVLTFSGTFLGERVIGNWAYGLLGLGSVVLEVTGDHSSEIVA